MKAGDLVRLSEYGIKRDYNNALTMENPYQVGFITGVFLGSYPYKVYWMKAHRRPNLTNSHSRRELKYAIIDNEGR